MNTCLTCKVKLGDSVYTVPDSQIKAEIFICSQCGLMQTRPLIEHTGLGQKASAGPDWGGLRYGKGFGADKVLDILRINQIPHNHILDIGAGRGYIARKFVDRIRFNSYIAVEPNKGLYPDCLDTTCINWDIQKYLDDCPFTDQHFDIVIMSHTLEHLVNPLDVLRALAKITNDGGRLYIEVPNAGILPECFEEFFIDRHMTHFTYESLRVMVENGGWRLLEAQVAGDTIKAVACPGMPYLAIKPGNEAKHAVSLIKRYSVYKEQKTAELRGRVKEINSLPDDTIIWGNGRIFDFMTNLGMESRLVVDSYRPNCIRPEDVSFKPSGVIITSREYFDEIKQKAQVLWPGVRIYQL